MKLSIVATTGLFAVALGTKPKQCFKKCFDAIVSDTPLDLGQAFCSSFLSIEPLAPVTATVTVTTDAVVTTTHSNTETTTTTEVTTGTTVTTITDTVTQFEKRAPSSISSDPASASILSACKTKSALISRICSSLVTPASAATSTLTVAETGIQTTVIEVTTTAVETTTETVTETSAAVATESASFVGDFENGLGLWISSADTTESEHRGSVEIIASENVCVDSASNCHTSTICRMTAPITGPAPGHHVAIEQTFTAAPSTTYRLSFLLNSRYGGAGRTSWLLVSHGGIELGTYFPNVEGIDPFYKTISIWDFTTRGTGEGRLEIQVRNDGGTGEEYLDLDDITLTRMST